MTDLNQNTETNVDNVDNVELLGKAEFTPDDLRAELDKLQNKLRVVEIEAERERKRADEYLEKNQNVTAGIYALIEPEILSAFTSMLEEAMGDIVNGDAFENAVDSIVTDRIESDGLDRIESEIESQIEQALERSEFVVGDDVDERISEAVGDGAFDSAVRDVVRDMINDGDIRLTFDSV